MGLLQGVFGNIALLLLIAAAVGAVALRLRQPLIVSFIGVGILVGPSGLRWVRSTDEIHLLAELGLALLLFLVGLKLDLGLIRTVGPVALAAGLGQVAFTSVLGFFICLALDMSVTTSIYVAVALTFSSTIIIVKLLSDKRETESLHGRIAIGMLIVQDILVVIAMIVLSGARGDVAEGIGYQIAVVAAKGLGLVTVVAVMMYTVLPRVLEQIARSPELLVLFAIAWAAVLATAGDVLGVSKEVGAFLGGMSLASTRYREMLGARLVSLRDFLLLFFFVDLGTRLDLGLLGNQVWSAVPLSLFVLIGNPLIVMVIMGAMGYRRRTGFLTGLTVAQISEFSLVLIALGMRLGDVGPEAAGVVTLVGMITIALSTYMILYSHTLYEWMAPYLGIFERSARRPEQSLDTAMTGRPPPDIIVFGLGRYGTAVARQLASRNRPLLGVDFDPRAVKRWSDRGWPSLFGDAEDPEFAASLPLSDARWVISSLRDTGINLTLIQALRGHGYIGSIAATANTPTDADKLKRAGADLVFVPYTDAASQAADLLELADREEARRKMDRLIAGLNDHYIVCGYGRMGQEIVREFEHHGVPFVVVEHNPEQIPKLEARGVPFANGRATEDEVLLQAGIERAKGLISVAATDEENVFIVLTARGLNPNLRIVARSTLVENETKLLKAGADLVMSPYTLGGRKMAAAMLRPGVVDFLDLLTHTEHEDLDIRDITVASGSQAVDKPISESEVATRAGALVLAVRRGRELVPNPEPGYVLRAGDQLILMGSPAQIETARSLLRPA